MYSQIASNKRKTIIIMAAFVVFIGLFSFILSKATGNGGFVVGMTIFAIIYAVISYYASARIALAISGAKPIAKADAPDLYRAVENLSIAGGLPMPQVYIMDDPALNAFATGRDPNHAVVAVTSGLLATMDREELEGVLAHELSHVGNYDIRLMAVVMVLVTILSVLSNIFLRMTFWRDDDSGGDSNTIFLVVGIVLAILAPILGTLTQLAVSRKREFLADASGALLTRYPQGLESALQKIADSNQPLRTANTATAHLFFANPFRGKGVGSGVAKLFSTHPPIAERIDRLKQMETHG